MELSRKISFCKFGAVSSMIAGLCYLIIAFMGFRMPETVTSFIASHEFFNQFEIYKLDFYNLKFLTVLANLAMIAVVCSYLSLCRDKYAGIVTFSSLLAIIGYSFGFYHSFIDLFEIPNLVKQYLSSPQSLKDVILAFGFSNPLLFCITHGLPGIWFLVVSLIGFTNKQIPKFLLLLGIMWGVGNILTTIAHVLHLNTLIYFISMQVLIFAPLWGFSEGFYLLHMVKHFSQEESNQKIK